MEQNKFCDTETKKERKERFHEQAFTSRWWEAHVLYVPPPLRRSISANDACEGIFLSLYF